jgi:hypothetical protein
LDRLLLLPDAWGLPRWRSMVMTTTSWPRIREVTGELQAAFAAIEIGSYRELFIP